MSSTLNPDEEPQPGGQTVRQTAGTTGALGPSDSSDSGSDVAGAKRHEFDVDSELDNHALETGDAELGSDTDRSGTGERAAADGDSTLDFDRDIDVDRVIDPLESPGADEDEGEGEDETNV
ncbi:chemotaxis protein [Paraburkholderia antibiotica]|uniref:Chemotaxis protein n=1 Tax=Paraburkholderia antibiotica TaxID=2728839 RepID=A0A7X9ZYE4_9BURK|nr:chemotaxis protein [Paraburkholderia antibiotica]NML32826.1 chemotaxis protein [Paraburkholderia antibiotica]